MGGHSASPTAVFRVVCLQEEPRLPAALLCSCDGPAGPDSASCHQLQAGRVRPRGAEPPAAHPSLLLGGRNASGILVTFSYITLGTQ